MEKVEATYIHRRTRVIIHNKNTMATQGEVGECRRRVEGEACLDQPRDRQQQMDIGMFMMKEGAVRVEGTQMAPPEEVALHS
jgi:hypothetical protein